MDDGKIWVLVLIVIVYVGVTTFGITKGIVVENERSLACVAVGYESYDVRYEACVAGSTTIVLYPYEEALAGKGR